ncbi:hypothetical protein KII36_001575 [Salmonella enterica]|nr:hypothetical protein [Salmonella enterica]
MNSQQTMTYCGMQIPPPVLNIDLHVLPNFTGRVVLYIEIAREAGIRFEEISNVG